MIIEFSVGNYRSFNEIQTVSFRATGLISEDKAVDRNNIAEFDGQRLLKTIGVYGANGSGKSNLIYALNFFVSTVLYTTFYPEDLFKKGIEQFKLSDGDGKRDSYFQIVFLEGVKKYRYGFTINSDGFSNEWLYGPAEENETFYFQREGIKVNTNSKWFTGGVSIPNEQFKSQMLFLNFCSPYIEVAGHVRSYISNKIQYDKFDQSMTKELFNRGYDRLLKPTDNLIENGNKNIVLAWMKEAGLPFNDVKMQSITAGDEVIGKEIYFSKNVFDEKGRISGAISMSLRKNESLGTQKFYSYIGQFYDLFENGGVFVSDEIDSNFHPALLRKIISMFNDPTINKANAQLLFTSHDTNLMSPDIMRRDQFYFTEKSNRDETILYSLADLKGIRNNADFAKQYLAGFYGALPVLGDFMEEENTSDENPKAAK